MSDWETLENLARRAHKAGTCWSDFLEKHNRAIAAAEPHNIQQFGRLRQRLLHILLTGEASGQYAAGDDDAGPWETDDAAWQPNDTRTEARLQPGVVPGR